MHFRRFINEKKWTAFSAASFAAACAGLLAAGLLSAVPAFAMTKHIDLAVDLEDIPEHVAGEAFLPTYELEDEDDGITFDLGDGPESTANPTIPCTVRITVHSDNESLDEDLQIRGTGIRATYVDYVTMDNSEAEGRLQIYPFYELPAPQPVIDRGSGLVSWAEVLYAGKYEYVVTYVNKNGSEKTRHGTTKQTNFSISSDLAASADGTLGVAVRALATEEEGYSEAVIQNGTASWDHMDWADKYRIRISFTNISGQNTKKEFTVTGTSYNVQSYIASAADGQVSVTVRAIPKTQEHGFYNIALSEFGTAGERPADTDDYEVDDPWEFLADYSAVVDGNFSSRITTGASTGLTGVSTGPAASLGGLVNAAGETVGSAGTWKRVTYRWQYLIDGMPYNAGWLKIGTDWYYFDPDGYVHSGWLTDSDGRQYYLESVIGSGYGRMVTGTREIGGTTCVFGSDGARIQ